MRLDKYVAQAGGISRADARKQIMRGNVQIDGVVCSKADAQLRGAEIVTLDGAPMTYSEFVYIMLDKPEGVVSAARDSRDPTVNDLVRESYPRRELFPAGRLDKASTGFVLLTDDGAFAHALLAPARHVPKTYHVTLDTPLTPAMIEGFAKGVTLVDGSMLKPAEVRVLDAPERVEVVLRQGVYHQIKRMFGVYDAGVNALRRVNIGGVALDAALGAGGYRDLTQEEVAALFRAAQWKQ